MIRRFASLMLPKDSKRRRFARKLLVKVGLVPPIAPGYYNTLYQQAHQHITPVTNYREKHTPLISIVVPAYNTKQRYMDELVYSVLAQTYVNWELVLVNASTDPERGTALREIGQKDRRIKIIDTENKGISGNTNIGIEHASGEFVAFSDHDDVLDPGALQEVATAISEEKADVVYTDEDKITDDSEVYYDPHFKPGWSPDLFTHVNYINHLTAVRRELLVKVGLLNPDRDGAQDYDLLLRVFDTQPKIVHVPKVLYHWRAADGSTARDFSLKTNVTEAASSALTEHFKRLSVKVSVKPKPNQPGFYTLDFPRYEKAAVIVVPFASDAALRLYNEILVKQTTFTVPTQLIVPEGTQPRFDVENLSVISINIKENYIQQALQHIKSEVVICLGTIAFPEDSDWITALSATLRQPHVNAVSPLLLIDGDIIDDCGLMRYDDSYLPLFKNQVATNNQTFFGNTNWVRNVDRLTGNIIAVRTKDFMKHVNKNTQLEYFNMVAAYEEAGKYNLLYSSTRFNRNGIRLAKQSIDTDYFNPNLDPHGDGYAIYMPESAAINVMMHIAESKGIDL